MYRKENAQIYTMKQALKHNERLLKEVKLKTKQNKTLEKVHHLSFCYLKIYLDNSTGEVIHALKRKRPCSVAQFSCLEHCPVNRKVGSSIPSQGTYKRQPINVSLSHLSLSPSPPPPFPFLQNQKACPQVRIFFLKRKMIVKFLFGVPVLPLQVMEFCDAQLLVLFIISQLVMRKLKHTEIS